MLESADKVGVGLMSELPGCNVSQRGQTSISDSAEKPLFVKILGDQKSLTHSRKSIVGHL